jgi:hypothetical protein
MLLADKINIIILKISIRLYFIEYFFIYRTSGMHGTAKATAAATTATTLPTCTADPARN